jgi:ATP-dependent Clp protease ATP-binding subunit ClpB
LTDAGTAGRRHGHSRAILKATEDALNKLPKVSGSGAGQVYLAPELARAFDAAEKAADRPATVLSPSSGCCSG